jgi:hypothetical protein
MTADQKPETRALLADAARGDIDRKDVLGRLSTLTLALRGKDRFELQQRVCDSLNRRRREAVTRR